MQTENETMIDLVLAALKQEKLVPEDYNNWDIVFDFRNYICKVVLLPNSNDPHVEYKTVLDIVLDDLYCEISSPWETEITIVGMPINTKKRA